MSKIKELQSALSLRLPEQYIPWKPTPHQTAFLLVPHKEVLFGGSGGGGKALSVTTPLLRVHDSNTTRHPWTTIGDLEVGDYVYDQDGAATKVLAKSEVFHRDTYKITMEDGEEIFACDAHLWNVATRSDRNNTPEFEKCSSIWDYTRTVTTEELASLVNSGAPGLSIPMGGATTGTQAWNSAVSPYVLGLWLGGGCSTQGYLAVGANDCAAIKAEIEQEGWNVSIFPRTEHQTYYNLKITKDGISLKNYLEAGGFIQNKHVPDWVINTSFAERQAFLEGLFDTKGHVDGRGRIQFCLAREDMAREVHSIVWSIGIHATSVKHKKTNSQDPEFSGHAWRFDIFQYPEYLFVIPRKRNKFREVVKSKHQYTDYRYIKSVEKVPPVPTQCIQVDNPRGLFRVGRTNLVTHNSVALLMGALQYVENPNYNALILRRTFKDLAQPGALIDLSMEWLKPTDAKWSSQDKKWKFPSGAVLQFGHMESENDKVNYQGAQYHFCAYDEITQFTETMYTYLFSRLRKLKDTDIPIRMRATGNPGGVGHCIPHGEVLTPHGWVDISKFSTGDPVYQVSSDGLLEETVVRQIHRHTASHLIKVKGRGLTMEMTPEHRVAKVRGTKGNPGTAFSLVPFKNLPGQANILRSVNWAGTDFGEVTVPLVGRRSPNQSAKTLSSVNYATLMGWFLSEGCLHPDGSSIDIAQMKEPNRTGLINWIKSTGLHYRLTPTSVVISDKCWWEHLNNYKFGKCREKYVPTCIKNSTPEILEAFFTSAMLGDGHRYSPGSGVYYTTSKQLADDMSEIAVKLGYIVYTRARPRENREGLSYSISFKTTKSGGTEVLTGNHVYSVETTTKRQSCIEEVYTDIPQDVYCIGVDSHAFVVRQNGSVWVSGNSWTKERFIDPPDPDTMTPAEIKKREQRLYIPSSLWDNPYLDHEDYVESLNELDAITRAQLMHGDWNIAADGNMFKAEWFDNRVITSLPRDVQLSRNLRYWDLASTDEAKAIKEKGDPDYTASVLQAIGSDGNIYILEVSRDRVSPAAAEKLVRSKAERDGRMGTAIYLEQEPGSSGVNTIHTYRKMLMGFNFRGDRPTGSKIERARAASAACENGLVYIVRGKHTKEFLAELQSFPMGGHDDMVDAFCGGFNKITESAVLGRKKIKVRKKRRNIW